MKTWIVCFMMMFLLLGSTSVQAQGLVPELSAEMMFDSGAWVGWAGGSEGAVSVDVGGAVFGQARVDVGIGDSLGGLELPGGIPDSVLAAPWHMEIKLTRPVDQNTAIGLLMPDGTDGTQGLFNNLGENPGRGPGGTTAFFGGAFWTGNPGPGFGTVSDDATIEIYFGVTNAAGGTGFSTQWGVRPGGSAVWNMAPPTAGSASSPGMNFNVVRLMIENRQGWFNQWAVSPGGSAVPAPSAAYPVDVDYIRVYNDIPEPATMSLLGIGTLALLRRRKKA